jgi:hypothetical protein
MGRAELAHIYVMVGDYDRALDELAFLLSVPSYITIPVLRMDPRWDVLHERPRFQQLLLRST